MDKTSLKFAKDEEGSLLIWTPPLDIVADSQPVESFVIPYQSRPGGALFAVPACFLDENYLVEANSNDDESGLLGPSHLFYSDLIEEAEDAAVVAVGRKAPVVLVDLADEALEGMREYDPVTDSTAHFCPFDEEKESAIVSLKDIDAAVKSWVDGIASGRQNFYSAREEPPAVKAPPKRPQKKVSNAALADQVAGLMAQIQLLSAQQQELRDSFQPPASAIPVDVGLSGKSQPVVPNVAPTSKVGIPKATLQLVGPPPKTRVPMTPQVAPGALVEDEVMDPLAAGSSDLNTSAVATALTQQSTAITALVAHLASGDPLSELATGGGGSSGLSGKGVARREKMQSELASGSSSYFLAVHQQLFKKMFPSSPVPRSEADIIHSGATMCAYLEKHGNFKGQKDLAMTMWILAHAFDSAGRDDFKTCKEFLALLAASLDQASLDGNWSIAYLISLLEEPPSQMMMERHSPLSSLGRPFAGMVPPQWSAVALAYVREMDLLQSRKNETKPGRAAKKEEDSPSPKRRPKFPKKPKPPEGGGEK